jgi:hypothetical protein
MGYKPFSLGPWSSTALVRLSFTKKKKKIEKKEELVSAN